MPHALAQVAMMPACPVPDCPNPRAPRHYLCRACWYALPVPQRRRLNLTDHRALLRLSSLYRQVAAGTPLGQVEIPAWSAVLVSYGGGDNSAAMLVGLRARGQRPDAILFADTGGEKRHTYGHMWQWMQPWLDDGTPAPEACGDGCFT